MACGQSFTGMTYNPIGVSLTGTYTSECSPDNQLRCALGDTWRKTGTIDLDSGRILRQDSFMPVSGGYSGKTEHVGCAKLLYDNVLLRE